MLQHVLYQRYSNRLLFTPLPKQGMSSLGANLLPRVLSLFGQRVGAWGDSGDFVKINFFDWLLSVMACIVLAQKSCGNKIPVPQSLSGLCVTLLKLEKINEALCTGKQGRAQALEETVRQIVLQRHLNLEKHFLVS